MPRLEHLIGMRRPIPSTRNLLLSASTTSQRSHVYSLGPSRGFDFTFKGTPLPKSDVTGDPALNALQQRLETDLDLGGENMASNGVFKFT